ncbi:MAG TPA: sugar phosphate isomerase/epimerase family protein [Bradyrhizobium sp.]|nr:sugar phosphate isomerase/epimerase family protein [Bradyrhizobium sp.]
MKLALCNEVIAEGRDFVAQCRLAAGLGYQGLEVAPFTLDEEPHKLSARRIAEVRRVAEDAGLSISGLHWLLVKPTGLSITSDDPGVRDRTREVMRRLVDLCAALGGEVLVHGSPAQRRLPDDNADAARGHAVAILAAIAEHAERAGVTYCIEPLAAPGTNFINTLDEAAAILRQIGSPALRTMIDCSAAVQMESEPPDALVERWFPTGLLAHIQVNDRNKRGPGQGTDSFAPLIAALKRLDYRGWIAVEPFEYEPDGAACAARSIGYLQGLIEATQ